MVNINMTPVSVKDILGLTIIKNMKVDFCLTIDNAVISGKIIDYLELRWQEDLSPGQLAGRFNRWLYDEEFIKDSLPDLHQAAHCLLSINPT